MYGDYYPEFGLSAADLPKLAGGRAHITFSTRAPSASELHKLLKITKNAKISKIIKIAKIAKPTHLRV